MADDKKNDLTVQGEGLPQQQGIRRTPEIIAGMAGRAEALANTGSGMQNDVNGRRATIDAVEQTGSGGSKPQVVWVPEENMPKPEGRVYPNGSLDNSYSSRPVHRNSQNAPSDAGNKLPIQPLTESPESLFKTGDDAIRNLIPPVQPSAPIPPMIAVSGQDVQSGSASVESRMRNPDGTHRQ